MEIVQLSRDEIVAHLPQLCALLIDAVDGGASVSYLAPMAHDAAERFWQAASAEVAAGSRLVLAATLDGQTGDRQVAGCVHLSLAMQPNAAHRAEIQKMLVHSAYRRRGLATALLATVERAAQQLGRTLIVLDTEEGSVAEQLYTRAGYQRVGTIPRFARSSRGDLHGTVLFYKELADA